MSIRDKTPSVATIQLSTSATSSRETDQDCSFVDIDNRSHLLEILHSLKNNATRNFVVEFNDDIARAAVDLTCTGLTDRLQAERDASQGTRWINIWHPYAQRDLLQQISCHYDFSPRLFGLLCSRPSPPSASQSKASNTTSESSFWHHSKRAIHDEEHAKDADELSEHSSLASSTSAVGGNIYRIAENIWHYTSVDLGRSYVCIGYNSLYGTRNSGGERGQGLLPYCVRVWTWLIICDDNTIITINEDPFPNLRGTLDIMQQRILEETRRNLINVFYSLSNVGDDHLLSQNPLTLLPIRTRLGDRIEETAHRDSDAPGLLFFYLFENWHNSYTLITRRESRYGIELARLRAEMFDKPTLHHIDQLDRMGQELGVLQRHYSSYEKIIDRLVEPQTQTAASLENSLIATGQSSLRTVQLVTEQQSMLGVSLSSAARAKFKRLRDVIDLYALSEVEEYIKQKDALVAMNFNLIAIKQSTDVERLTRITLLITKFTLLFLPISLLTAYFSVQLVNVEYTVAEYWVSFSIMFALSILVMLCFGVFSKNVQATTLAKFFGIFVKRMAGTSQSS